MNELLYIYSNCSPHKYKDLVESSGIMILQQAQKYHQLMLEGISNNGYDVTALSSLPVNRSLTKRIIFRSESDTHNNIKYRYLPFINLPLLRSFSIFFCSLLYCLKHKNIPIVCDILNTSISTGALIAAKLTRKKAIGIVTDIPGDFFGKGNLKIIMAQKISRWLLGRFNAYLFLTDQMNELINKNRRPYTVVEGQVDVEMDKQSNVIENKYDKKVCIYAGSLDKRYGIGLLVESFIKANVMGSELHIYGDGDYALELNEVTIKSELIKYLGVKPNSHIIKEQLKASLLINPRPTAEEFTKYSFPSKNMEYMASGTPTLTTKLPGMPTEYYEYVYLIEDETVEGLTAVLIDILSKPLDELHEKGARAKDFVLREKNNIKQAKKLIDIIEGLN